MRGLPLFINPWQIQLACGLPSNPINLLSCESTQQLLPISHFSPPLIRSAQDIQWGSLQPHLRCYSCCQGSKATASAPISPSLLHCSSSPSSSVFLPVPSFFFYPFPCFLHLTPVPLSPLPLHIFLPCASSSSSSPSTPHPSSIITPNSYLSLFSSLSPSPPSCSYTVTTKQPGQ